MTKNQSVPFAANLQKLEAIVLKMESGTLSLEDSLQQFEQGITLIRTCQSALKNAEQKVQILMEKNSQLVLEEFSNESNDDDDKKA